MSELLVVDNPITMRIGMDTVDYIVLKSRPVPQVANVITILGEFKQRVVMASDMAQRLGIDHDMVVTYVSRARRLLTEDWSIQCVHKQGYRLLDLR